MTGNRSDAGLAAAAEALRSASRVVVFTGAGISAESGIPTFRDALTGLWARFDAAALATPEAFDEDPSLVWGWYEWRRRKALAAQPNAGHRAVAALSRHCRELTLVTQNVDDLHERAGSAAVIHLHGSLHQPRCHFCAAPFDGVLPGAADDPPQSPASPPVCVACGGPVRPGVVWFGEPLPAEALAQAFAAAAACEVLISVGTSGLVYPAAQVPMVALQAGAVVIEVNPVPSGIGATHVLAGAAGPVLPALVQAAFGGG